jgi:cephalosporin hydroxylase
VLQREGVRSYLEIGSKFGGSLWRVANSMPRFAHCLGRPAERDQGVGESSESLSACIAALAILGHDARVIWGSSFDPKIIEQVAALAPFDAILIDADHRLPGVTADWNNYGPMGKIIAFHDIAWKRGPDFDKTPINVPEFWDGIKGGYRHEELKFCPTGKNNGIGVLWR